MKCKIVIFYLLDPFADYYSGCDILPHLALMHSTQYFSFCVCKVHVSDKEYFPCSIHCYDN